MDLRGPPYGGYGPQRQSNWQSRAHPSQRHGMASSTPYWHSGMGRRLPMRAEGFDPRACMLPYMMPPQYMLAPQHNPRSAPPRVRREDYYGPEPRASMPPYMMAPPFDPRSSSHCDKREDYPGSIRAEYDRRPAHSPTRWKKSPSPVRRESRSDDTHHDSHLAEYIAKCHRAAHSFTAALKRTSRQCTQLLDDFRDDTRPISCYADKSILTALWKAKMKANGKSCDKDGDHAKDEDSSQPISHADIRKGFRNAVETWKRIAFPSSSDMAAYNPAVDTDMMLTLKKRLLAKSQDIDGLLEAMAGDRDKIGDVCSALGGSGGLLSELERMWRPLPRRGGGRGDEEDGCRERRRWDRGEWDMGYEMP